MKVTRPCRVHGMSPIVAPGYLDAAGVAELSISEAEAAELLDRKEIPSITPRSGLRVTPKAAVSAYQRRQRGEQISVVTLASHSAEELIARFVDRYGRTPQEVVRDFSDRGFECTPENMSLWIEALALADLEI